MNDRAADSCIDFTAAGKQITLFPREVLDAIPTPTTNVLPQFGVAEAFPQGQAPAALLFELKEAQINATCAPLLATIYPSRIGPHRVESQCDMFEMSQGGA